MDKINLYLEYVWEYITFETAFKFFLVYFFVIWISLIVWVIRDISIRTNNIFFQIFSVFIILFLTPLWIFIYLLIRPSRTLYDKYYDEIEENLDIFNQIVEERKKSLELDEKVKESWLNKIETQKNFDKEEKLEIVNHLKEEK